MDMLPVEPREHPGHLKGHQRRTRQNQSTQPWPWKLFAFAHH